MADNVTTVDSLIPYLRLRIGDTNSASYRYIDLWLKKSLILAVKNLERFWNNKYLITDAGIITRNPNITFLFPESSGIIEKRDEYIIILMAALIILEGSLENSAWDVSSWRDAEISFTNLESGRIRNSNIQRMWNELNSLIKPPSKRLAWTTGYPLAGYKNNQYESEGIL